MLKKNKPASPASASRATASIPQATGPPDLTSKELARAWRPSDIAARRRAEELLQEPLTAPATGSRRELRRQQARRRREVLDRQAKIQLATQPQPRLLGSLQDFRRAERLAIRRKDRELECFLLENVERLRQAVQDNRDLVRFLSKHAKAAVRHWMKFFRRYRSPGRPRGTGHPKASPASSLLKLGLDPSKLKRAGLNDKDLKLLYAFIRTGTQRATAKELGVSAPAIHKRLRNKIYPALRKVNPRFSPYTLRGVAAEFADDPAQAK